MIGQVKTINGVKQIISISGEVLVDSVTDGSMSAVTSNAVYNAIKEITTINTVVISTTQSINIPIDTRILIDTQNITVTLDYSLNKEGVVVEIFAFEPTTITYYVDSTTTSSLSMDEDTNAIFIYFNGWHYNGIYNAIWN